jgi:hypothetical protein
VLDAIKSSIKLGLVPALYFGTLCLGLVTALRRAEWGLYLLIAMIPQPNVWHKL